MPRRRNAPDPVLHAKSYPFAIPEHSYVFEAGSFARLDPRAVDREGRTPVLAAGSNQSPEQLARKYGGFGTGREGRIPAERGRLGDFDVVYAAHLARYGSVPATFQHSPGTAVTVFVQWLTDRQLARMHETEGNYSYDHLEGVDLVLDDGAGEVRSVYVYSSKVGCLNVDGEPASLAAIAAGGRRFPALGQSEALSALRDRLAPGDALDAFIAAHIDDYELLRARSRALGADALPLGYRRRVVETL